MKQTALLAIIVGLSAVSMAAIYASDIDPTSLAVATPSSEKVGMYGHVEFVHSDSFGNIIGYYQSDNFITDMGASCAATLIFGGSAVSPCVATPTDFLFIGVGDQKNVDDVVTVTSLVGEIGVRKIDSAALITSDTGLSSASVIVETLTPFQFGTGNETNNIYQAGLFDSLTGGNVFAIQNTTGTNPNPGIDVNDGDTLNVIWDITVG